MERKFGCFCRVQLLRQSCQLNVTCDADGKKIVSGDGAETTETYVSVEEADEELEEIDTGGGVTEEYLAEEASSTGELSSANTEGFTQGEVVAAAAEEESSSMESAASPRGGTFAVTPVTYVSFADSLLARRQSGEVFSSTAPSECRTEFTGCTNL